MTNQELKRVKAARREIEQLQACAARLLGQDGGILPSSRGERQKNALQLMQLRRQMQQSRCRLIEQCAKAEQFIESLPDPTMRRVARARYLYGKSWQQVADECGFGSRGSASQAWYRYLAAQQTAGA